MFCGPPPSSHRSVGTNGISPSTLGGPVFMSHITLGTPQWKALPSDQGQAVGRSSVSSISLGAFRGSCWPLSGGSRRGSGQGTDPAATASLPILVHCCISGDRYRSSPSHPASEISPATLSSQAPISPLLPFFPLSGATPVSTAQLLAPSSQSNRAAGNGRKMPPGQNVQSFSPF